MKLKAFTLIELLIVVAIIAILAAIAVPNFLEAQTRAKISRAKADTRTVVTGLETYRIDNNKYPIDGQKGNDGQAFWYIPGGPTTTLAGGLTSPIAYLTTAGLIDPFRVGIDNSRAMGFDAPDSANFSNSDYSRYRYTNWDYTFNTNAGAATKYKYFYGTYRLVCAGPDKSVSSLTTKDVYTANGVSGVYMPYDATNGTISRGDIIRSEKHSEQPYML